MEQVQARTGGLPWEMSADTRYFSTEVVQELGARGIDVYMPPGPDGARAQNAGSAPGLDTNGSIDSGENAAQVEDETGTETVRTEEGAIRAGFRPAQIGERMGRFLLRGKEKVGGEWRYICTGHNVLKLFRARNAGLPEEEFWNQGAAA